MNTPFAQRDWRLLAAGSGGLLLLAAGITLHSHWSDFLQWCLATQITLHRYLVMYLLLLNNHQYSGGVWLLVGAFLYGVLHAIGPGHGKFIVTTYLSTNQELSLIHIWRESGVPRREIKSASVLAAAFQPART